MFDRWRFVRAVAGIWLASAGIPLGLQSPRLPVKCSVSPKYVPIPAPDRVAEVWSSRKKYRLVIGAGAFPKDRGADRPQIAETAKAVDKQLEKLGYGISLGIFIDGDATKAAVVNALQKLSSLPPEAIAVVYYIGHGIPVSGGDDLRLAVADEPVSEFNGVPIRELLRSSLGSFDPQFRKIPRVIFILESCYAAAGANFLLSRVAAGLNDARRLVFLSATSASEQARPLLKNGDMFAFGAYLVRALTDDWPCADRTADGALTLLELRTYLASQLNAAKDRKEIDGKMTPDLVDFGLYSTVAYRADRVADLHGFRDVIVEMYADFQPGMEVTFTASEGQLVAQCSGSCGVLTDSPESIDVSVAAQGFSLPRVSGVELRKRGKVSIYDPSMRPGREALLGTVSIRK